MSSQPLPYLTPEQYLALDRQAERPSECYDGELFETVAATAEHGHLTANLITSLTVGLRGSTCRVYNASPRLFIWATGLYTYADVMVVCGPLSLVNGQRDMIDNPVTIFEVLSPSTKDYDLGGKFDHYRTVASLREYVLVAQDRPYTQQRLRSETRRWEYIDTTGLDAVAHLPSLGIDLPLAELYDGVEFPSP